MASLAIPDLSFPLNRLELQALFSEAMAARDEGKAKAGSAVKDLDGEYVSHLLLEMRKRLSLSEITTLLRASEIREFGLGLMRSGKLLGGEEAIRYADVLCRRTSLSPEASHIFECFQAPALAFLYYKQRKYADACSQLLSALKACQILSDEYKYNIESRRIHLARNIVRVKISAHCLNEAAVLAPAVIGYLQGDVGLWPFPDQALLLPPWPIDSDLIPSLSDQLLGEIVLLRSKNAAVAQQALKAAYLHLFRGQYGNNTSWRRVYIGIAALYAHVDGDVVAFLRYATDFLPGGPDQMYQSWNAIEQALAEVSEKLMDDCQPLTSPGKDPLLYQHKAVL